MSTVPTSPTAAQLAGTLATQLGAISSDQSTVSADQQKLAADQAQESTDVSGAQQTLDALLVQAKAEGLAINLPAAS